MKPHPRTLHVHHATARLRAQFWATVGETDLTLTEAALAANELMADALKLALRAERHGDTTKKADEA